MNEGAALKMDLVKQLAGRWEGTGTASYPTTQTFAYREVLVFTPHESQEMLHFEQRTWKALPDGSVTPSHWETGFLRFLPEGAVEMFNAQSGGRVEVARGIYNITGAEIVIQVESDLIGNDPRVRQTRRIYRFDAGCLRYTMEMETTAVTGLTAHLSAELVRQGQT